MWEIKIDRYIGKTGKIDVLLTNSDSLPEKSIKRYAREGSEPVIINMEKTAHLVGEIAERPLLSEGTQIRHDPTKLAAELMSLFQ